MYKVFSHNYFKHGQTRLHWLCFVNASNSAVVTLPPIKQYSWMLQKGILKPDRHQFSAVLKIQDLYNNLKNCGFKHKAEDKPLQTKGLYLYGGVGTGKTLLLDLFYDSVPIKLKKRVHFNAFMLYLYSEMNRWNLCCDDDVHSVSPMEHIANKIMQNGWLLCFDEIQLADYASCALLEGVVSHMIAKGALIVGTSNRAPQDLGDSAITTQFDGETSDVQASLSSFKSLFMENCLIHHVQSERDHRREMKQGEKRYHFPIVPSNEEFLDQQFIKLIPNNQKLKPFYASVYGRKVLVPMSIGNIARFSFKDLCCQPLGPADYITICNTYPIIFVDQIPKMSIQTKNEARRFLSFIDAAYECRVQLYCTAEASAKDLFTLLPRDDNIYAAEQMHMEMIGEIAYDLKLHGLDFKAMNIISGEDEIFSFKRAISRLHEMESLFYQSTKHRQQSFLPYIGTKSERYDAEKKRRKREKRRQKDLNCEGRTVNDEELHDSFNQEKYTRDYTETDWGDEASYITFSKETKDVLSKRKNSLYGDRQNEAPAFGEKHFWGFGWWEHVKSKVKKPKGPMK